MYQLRAPAPELSRFIEHYWFVGVDGAEALDLRVDVFVDGRADLIFNFGAPYVREVIGGEPVEMLASNLDAQRLVPIRIAQRGRLRTTGVRFRLGGLGPFARAELHRFTGATPAPPEVFGAAASEVERALESTYDAATQARTLDDFFRGCFQPSDAFGAFERALAHAVASRGLADVPALGEVAEASPRHVERLFARFLGFSPRVLGRVLRFQTALRALMRDPGGTLADVAVDAGYFDQAHFVREFKKMTGGLPRGYRGYFPPDGPSDFAPNVVAFVQDAEDEGR